MRYKLLGENPYCINAVSIAVLWHCFCLTEVYDLLSCHNFTRIFHGLAQVLFSAKNSGNTVMVLFRIYRHFTGITSVLIQPYTGLDDRRTSRFLPFLTSLARYLIRGRAPVSIYVRLVGNMYCMVLFCKC